MFKFLELTDVDGVVPGNEKVCGYNFRDFISAEYIIDNMTLLWNVQGYKIKAAAPAPFPTEKMVLYAHDLKIKYPGSKYLFDGGNLTNFYSLAHASKENVISVISETQEREDIFVCRIACKDDGYGSFTPMFAPQSNVRKMRHADRQAEIGRLFPFTEAEIERVCSAYSDIENSLKLTGVSVDDNIEDAGDGIDLNHFIETRGFDRFSRRLILKFDAADKTDRFLHEKMWFLVSEVQRYINEYRCVGRIV